MTSINTKDWEIIQKLGRNKIDQLRYPRDTEQNQRTEAIWWPHIEKQYPTIRTTVVLGTMVHPKYN